MKVMLQRILSGVVAVVLVSAVSTATAQTSPIRISVDVTGSTDTKRAKPPKKGGTIPKMTITQDKQLEITVANTTPTGYKGLTVKYYLFAKDLASKEFSIPRMGKQNIDLPGLGSAKVKSETLVTTYATQYSKKSEGELTFVPEEGKKFIGYGVQLLSGDAVLAETFEPPDLKSKLGTARIEPAGGKKKTKKYSKD
jgi:hypothetical protein